MKVIYKYNLDDEKTNDRFDLLLNEKSYGMYKALDKIQIYIREINKGWCEDKEDAILDKIQSFISESGYYDIE